MTLRPPHETFIDTNDDLLSLWQNMMGSCGFGIRSLWHVFVAEDGSMLPTVVPIEELPVEPDVAVLRNLAHAFNTVAVDEHGATVAALLSRPGPQQMSATDRRWARAVRESYGPRLSPWPMHLATRDRVQVFAPDDLIAA